MKIKNMTLRAQLNGVILAILVMSFIGSVSINIINMQTYLNDQLASHAQDTATSLGLSLSDPILNEESIVVEATISAIFDRGYYHHITLESIDGEIIYQRTIDNLPEQVPSWFSDLFTLHAPEQKTMIDTGWTVGGILKVQSHTGLAYEQLWNSACDMTHATLFIFIIALLLGYLFLQKMYRPITAISLQAEAVQRRQFIMIEKLPNALELRNFVLAMNKMVANIKSTFDELTQAAATTHNEAYIDPQTGIENRRAFIDAMDALLLESGQHSGYMKMIRITGLATLNKNHGYQAGDNLVKQLVEQIQAIHKDDSEIKLFRISGSEFCLILENYQHSSIEKLASELMQQVDRHIERPNEVKLACGCNYFSSGQHFGPLMSELDMATNLASELPQGFCVKQDKQQHALSSVQDMKLVLDAILVDSEQHIHLTTQRTLACSDRNTFDVELFAAFTYQDNRVNTGDLFAIASQYQQTGALDHAIIKLLITRCHSGLLADKKVAINLSRLTVSDGTSMDNITKLIKESKLGPMFAIGLPESAILGNIEATKTRIDKLSALGCSICINRFGSSMESMQYLMAISPDQVKLLPAFTRNIDQKQTNAQMVGAFVRLVHGLDISVVAQCVESEAELQALQKLNIDAILGYVIDKPIALQ